MKWIVIANPAAGHGRCAREVERAHLLLRERGIDAALVFTTAPGDGVAQGRLAAEQGYRGIAVAGGEGTVNEVINGLASVADTSEFTLATLPLGTSNSFLRDFALNDLHAAVDRIASGSAPPCDLLQCELEQDGVRATQIALNNILVGFGADVGDFMNRRLKFLGHRGYTAGVVAQLIRMNHSHMTVDLDGNGISERMTMVNIGNSQYTGGTMRISPVSIVDDGLLDVLTVDGMSRRELIRAFPTIFTGEHVKHPKISMAQGRSVSIECDRSMPVLIDGDVAGRTPLRVEVLPGAIRFVR